METTTTSTSMSGHQFKISNLLPHTQSSNFASNGLLIAGSVMVCVGMVNSLRRSPSSLNRFCHSRYNCRTRGPATV
ncbi:hypothetical protein M3Y98_00578700 [Aphelenchoides besseyi]|nr:hypothetical protein M3Y98_00578700 [Aphelenchoides besseyi]